MTDADLPLVVPDQRSSDQLQRRLPQTPVMVWDPAAGASPPDAVMVYLARPQHPPVLKALGRIPSLRLVQLTSLGYEWLLPHVPEGVIAANGRGTCEDSTAELAVHLVLASVRGARQSFDQQHARQWQPFDTGSVAGARVLVFGAGGVGQAIARRLQVFEPTWVELVATTSRTGPAGERIHDLAQGLERVVEADIVVLALPSGPATHGLVDQRFLSRLRPGTHLVNVGRGNLVDTTALANALHDGHLHAALDVVAPEPLPPSHPLWNAPHLIVSPHIGGNTTQHHQRGWDLVASQHHRLRTGQDVLNRIDDTVEENR